MAGTYEHAIFWITPKARRQNSPKWAGWREGGEPSSASPVTCVKSY